MCTVSFYKNKDQIIITSNRDENIDRPLAIVPMAYQVNGVKLFYPKDPQGSGSWFVVNKNGNVFVLLNGAKCKHISKPPYKKSRGLILLELASALNFNEAWISINLTNIEPFTIVVFVNNNLIQVRWNGNIKEIEILNNTETKIWSSSTLYTSEIIQKREKWFKGFIKTKNKLLNSNDFIDFHTKTQSQNSNNGLIINRDNKILTKSVTQYVLQKNTFNLLHFDLIENTKTVLTQI